MKDRVKEAGEAGEKVEREAIEKYGFGSSKFHMGHEEEISIVGHRFKRNTNTILGNELTKNRKSFWE